MFQNETATSLRSTRRVFLRLVSNLLNTTLHQNEIKRNLNDINYLALKLISKSFIYAALASLSAK